MKPNLAKAKAWISADFFSPKDFVRHAILIMLLFAVAHVGGLREFTTIICGTMASPKLGVGLCALLGMGYMALYFGTVVLTPILLIAAGLLKLWVVVERRRIHQPEERLKPQMLSDGRR